MLTAAHHTDAVYGQFFHHQHRLGTAVAAGLQGIQGFDTLDAQKLRGDAAIHIQHSAGPAAGVEFGGKAADLLPEGGDLIPVDGKACSQLVTTVAFQQMGKVGQRGE